MGAEALLKTPLCLLLLAFQRVAKFLQIVFQPAGVSEVITKCFLGSLGEVCRSEMAAQCQDVAPVNIRKATQLGYSHIHWIQKKESDFIGLKALPKHRRVFKVGVKYSRCWVVIRIRIQDLIIVQRRDQALRVGPESISKK